MASGDDVSALTEWPGKSKFSLAEFVCNFAKT